MAIAANFRKFPQAMALQLVLPLGLPVWNTSRPGSRLLRQFRAWITKRVKERGLVEHVQVQVTPQWVTDARSAARSLARSVRKACMQLDLRPTITRDEYDALNPFAQRLADMRISRGEEVAAWV